MPTDHGVLILQEWFLDLRLKEKENVMTRSQLAQTLTWASLVLTAVVVVAVTGRPGVGQEAAAAEQSSKAQPAAETSAKPTAEAPAEKPVPEEAKPKKREFRGRLPAYYGRVVDQKQREQIYAIQREYAPKIKALEAQLAALRAERDTKVEAVLTPEQLKTVEKLKAEAKAKRDKAKAAEK